jgi:superfamily II DNA or RNA helicase
LRPYQAEAIQRAREIYRARRARGERRSNVLLVAPTGAGKTRIGVELVTSALRRPGADGVIWMAHRKELVQQAHARLLAEGLGPGDVDIIAPWARRWPGARVHIASIETLAAAMGRGQELPKARVVVLDEAHHYAAESWGAVARCYDGSTVLGLTATPERGDGVAMGDLFDELIPVASVRQLIAMGVLVASQVYAPETTTNKLAMEPAAAYLAMAKGRRGFVFTTTVEHAQQIADALTAGGHPANVIHGQTPGPLRAALLEAFRSEDATPLRALGLDLPAPRALCNVGTLTEGVDVPAAEVCVLAHRIKHHGGYLQRVGRVLRASPGKERALILDLHGNVLRHGLPDASREFSLEGKAIALRGEKGEHKPTSCPDCGCVFMRWGVTDDGRRVCPECRTVGPKLPDPSLVERRELSEVGPMACAAARSHRLEALIREATTRERRPGWVWHRYRDLFGSQMPRAEWRRVKGLLGSHGNGSISDWDPSP